MADLPTGVTVSKLPITTLIMVFCTYIIIHFIIAVLYKKRKEELDNAIPNLDPNGKYLVYCHVDSVAIAGAEKLIDAGFTTVYRLEGNYGGWVAAGYEVEV